MRFPVSGVLRSRFFVVPVTLAIAVVAWNAYVSAHNGGLVRGRVVGPGGEPVAGATVSMMELNFTTNSDSGQVMSGADGRFEFRNNRSHSIQLRADKPGVGRSQQQAVRLYFRAQDVELAEPLRIGQARAGE